MDYSHNKSIYHYNINDINLNNIPIWYNADVITDNFLGSIITFLYIKGDLSKNTCIFLYRELVFKSDIDLGRYCGCNCYFCSYDDHMKEYYNGCDCKFQFNKFLYIISYVYSKKIEELTDDKKNSINNKPTSKISRKQNKLYY